MEKQDWVNDDQERRWNNALAIAFGSLFFLMLPLMSTIGFIKRGNFEFLIAAIILWCLYYELIVYTYIRVSYLNGELEFRKPLRKYSLLFRKKNHCMRIRPDEWTEVYRYTFRGGTAYYFRNNHTAAYFVRADGLNFLYSDLETLFPQRAKTTHEFPIGTRRRLKKADPGRVI